jgi:carboxylesterase
MIACVLGLHGLTGSPDELAPLAGALTAAGFRVRTPLLPGHGQDIAALARTTRHDWYAGADAALSSMVAECGGPVAIVGGSAGGLLAMRLAVSRPRDVRALVVLATPLRLPWTSTMMIRMALLMPAALRPSSFSTIAKPHGPNVSDRAMAAGLHSLNGYPIHALGDLLALMSDARTLLPRVTQPVLVVHGDLDAIVPRRQADALAAGLTNSERVTRLDLAGSAHLIAIDRDRDRLAREVIAFLRPS